SSALTVDSFPATLDNFYNLTVDSETSGLKLSWGQSGSVKFPVLRDADGDGLMSRAYSGGNDPDDMLYDTDSDGLSDFYEIANSMNPRMVDTDDDGLSDYLEVIARTVPTRKDTDGDGLTDAEEVAGWLYTYDFDSIGAPLETMVYPDPLSPDTDLDGVTDYLERVYGFHPGVPQNSDVLDYELTLREQDSPLIMLRLNENAGAMVFADSANYGFAASCSADECPTAGIDGRYATAARFDGSDLLHLPTSAKAISLSDNQPFTFAGWVNTETGGTLFARWSDAAGSQQDVRFEITGDRRLRLASRSTTATSSAAVPASNWTFVSAVFTGSQAPGEDNLFFYINGNAAGSTVFSTPATVDGSLPTEITLGAYQGAGGLTGFYQGDLDEMAFFDHALSAADLAERWMAARYNFNDTFVRPGEEVVYRSTVTNLLNSRFAYGLLTTLIDKVDAIVDWATKLIPNTFVLYPDNPVVTGVNTETIETRLQIEPGHAVSEDVTITQTAEAQIVDRRSESNLAALWLQFEEGDAAASFVDNSGNMPPRDATCSNCPASNQAGILNKAVRFQSGQSNRIDLPALGTLDLLNRGYTLSMWVRPMDTATAGARIPLLGSDSNRLSITLVRQADSSFKPEVLVNGVNQVGTVWRTMKASVWSHLVVEFFSASNTLKVYINGGEIVSTTATPLTANANLWLGGASAPTDFYVDDLRIFNRPLSITDVNRLAERTVLELNMDGAGFANSSPYPTNVSTPHNWPKSNSNAVR
ncbi:MAG TPA: LamG-like jellyroll fold domain-containing protein, partial [Anaerolineaceae bacterium]|nr:LamG-like jellyroll fold domain-containing protein [Anaerolineaceae bacterium]